MAPPWWAGRKPSEDEQVRQIASIRRLRDLVDNGFCFGISENSFHLILKAIMLKPRNQLLWETRRWLLQAYGRSRKLELEYFRTLDGEAGDILKKSYEIWFHRFWLAKAIGPEATKQEVDSIKNFLVTNPDDSRLWYIFIDIVQQFRLPDLGGEFKFVDNFLTNHPMACGAWAYRKLLGQSPFTNKLEALKFTDGILLGNVNNLDAWTHRNDICDMLDLNEKNKELEDMKYVYAHEDYRTCKYFWYSRHFIAASFPKELSTNLANLELQFSREVLLLDIKNCYAWFHRRWVFKILGTIDKEDELKWTRHIIEKDVNNRFAWFHRKWLVKEFGGSDDELEFCNEILQKDVCCALAWNQRAFLVLEYAENLSDEMREAEVKYATRAISRDPKNEFAWKYLVLLCTPCVCYDSMIDEVFFSLLSPIMNVINGGVKDKSSLFVNVLGTLLELSCCGYRPSQCIGDMITKLCLKASGMMMSSGLKVPVSDFINIISTILVYDDPTKAHFWECLKSEIITNYASICSSGSVEQLGQNGVENQS
ncbi:proteinfarnesyltransferase/ geranylgeranyltransferase type-1 subunit alpha [Striga asiatica]|uniref:Protein farnesyltransferase/geranylgeranyltransferase type-1 subunit alpha n=1 Tax=Striga asiatica TaxID=4170 RepID=A0A5A7QNT8_STRAF|nr:proteinfarnesyltransferase/ geranylgeranyltransferase type-1 subunit alpha [Striga asiatica]